MTVRMDKMSWKQIQEHLERGVDTVVVGVGSTEQHGPSLPLRTDRKTADFLANMVARELDQALQAPTIGVGFCPYHLNFPGTISLQHSTLKAIICDYVDSLVKHGFKKIVFTNSHGGNHAALLEGLVVLREKYPNIKFVHFYDQNTMEALGALCMQFQITPGELGVHAGDMETSIMMFIDGENVNAEELVKGYTEPITEELRKTYRDLGFDWLTSNGVAGDQRKATPEKGQIYISTLKSIIIDYIKKELKAA